MPTRRGHATSVTSLVEDSSTPTPSSLVGLDRLLGPAKVGKRVAKASEIDPRSLIEDDPFALEHLPLLLRSMHVPPMGDAPL